MSEAPARSLDVDESKPVAAPKPDEMSTASSSDESAGLATPARSRPSISTAEATVACDVIPTPSPRQANAVSSPPRSNSFSKSSPHDTHLSPAMEWRNKSVSCDALRGFESSRKTYIDQGQSADRRYWELFSQEVHAAREHNQRLLKFFVLKLQADTAYAESLRRLRLALEPIDHSSPASKTKNLQAASSCEQSISALGENQQLLSEKLEMFVNSVQRDVISRPLQEMINKYDAAAIEMLAEGDALDALLHLTQRRVQEAFTAYDSTFRDMERQRQAKDPSIPSQINGADLWLAELSYGIQVKKLQSLRVEYVKGMASLFQQFKTLEILRVSVTQSALDIFMRKQKLVFEELGGSVVEPLGIIQKIDPEKDLIQTIRRIPRNNTALALSSDSKETSFFASYRSPLVSPLLIRCGFLKYQINSTMFKSWKEIFGVVTQDRYLHIFEMNKKPVDKSLKEFLLESIETQQDGIECKPIITIYLRNSRLTISKGTIPTFEMNEAIPSSGLFSVFKTESTKRHIFQTISQLDLVDWIVAIKRLIPDPIRNTC